MTSKTLLATNPRHRPSRDHVTRGWREVAPGHWACASAFVRLESDGLWHSYVTTTESVQTSPGYYAIPEAMNDAEQRTERMLRSA